MFPVRGSLWVCVLPADVIEVFCEEVLLKLSVESKAMGVFGRVWVVEQ